MDIAIHLAKGQVDGLLTFTCVCIGASLAVCLGRWLGEALVRWERQGRR